MIVDVSANNGTINFPQLEGIELMFIRSSLGYGDFDKRLNSNASGAQVAGIPVGYYHFAYPHSGVDVASDAIKQANYFCDTINKLPTPKHLAIDLENFSATKDATLTQEDYAAWLQNFMDTVEAKTGIRCIIYTYADYLNRHLPVNHTFWKYDLWIANYSANLDPTLPRGWHQYWAWQYSETGQIKGIEGHVDLSRLNGKF